MQKVDSFSRGLRTATPRQNGHVSGSITIKHSDLPVGMFKRKPTTSSMSLCCLKRLTEPRRSRFDLGVLKTHISVLLACGSISFRSRFDITALSVANIHDGILDAFASIGIKCKDMILSKRKYSPYCWMTASSVSIQNGESFRFLYKVSRQRYHFRMPGQSLNGRKNKISVRGRTFSKRSK